jgi:formylglycine-generating enzyme required for sulfatase activity
MGSDESEPNRQGDEGPQKKVTLTAFWMSAHEITRDLYDIFLKDESTSINIDADAVTRPSAQYVDLSWGMGKEGGYPANSMSQYNALMFCKWLYKKTGLFYRLPTEAEWEYACRAGTTTPYYFGKSPEKIADYAWFSENSTEKYHPVGQKKPNAWGLYDMLGNVLEWTLDHYDENAYSVLGNTDPTAPPTLIKYPKALRGGSFEDAAIDLRSARRFYSDPEWNQRDPQIPRSKWWLTEAKYAGFRIVCPLQQPDANAVALFFKQYIGK